MRDDYLENPSANPINGMPDDDDPAQSETAQDTKNREGERWMSWAREHSIPIDYWLSWARVFGFY